MKRNGASAIVAGVLLLGWLGAWGQGAATTQVATTRVATTRAAGPRAVTLRVGDVAPKLEVERWVKGEGVTEFEAGKVYVVEFWATWCGPCVAVMPDLTWLQKKYPEVVFIGVNVRETDPSLVDPFVKKMGDRMGYRVGADVWLAGGKGGPVWEAWMEASGERAIPCSFVIGRDGRVAAITHPQGLRGTLELVLGGKALPKAMTEEEKGVMMGKWKAYSAATKRKAWDEAEALLDEVFKGQSEGEYNATRQGLWIQRGDYARALAGFERVEALAAVDEVEPSTVKMADDQRMWMLSEQKDVGGMNALLKKVAERRKGDAKALNSLVWDLIGEERGTGQHVVGLDLELVLKVALEASAAAGGEDGSILDTVARVWALKGEFGEAVKVQERAVGLSKGKQREGLEKTLGEYREGKVK